MEDEGKRDLARRYAGGDVTWWELQERGYRDYVEVLAYLGELGLGAPIAPMEGPNVEARLRGRALLREALQRRG